MTSLINLHGHTEDLLVSTHNYTCKKHKITIPILLNLELRYYKYVIPMNYVITIAFNEK